VTNDEFLTPVPPQTSRKMKLGRLKQYFLCFIVEDPIDGSRFDLDVLTAIEKLEKQYENDD
jgi:hypothetical protein